MLIHRRGVVEGVRFESSGLPRPISRDQRERISIMPRLGVPEWLARGGLERYKVARRVAGEDQFQLDDNWCRASGRLVLIPGERPRRSAPEQHIRCSAWGRILSGTPIFDRRFGLFLGGHRTTRAATRCAPYRSAPRPADCRTLKSAPGRPAIAVGPCGSDRCNPDPSARCR